MRVAVLQERRWQAGGAAGGGRGATAAVPYTRGAPAAEGVPAEGSTAARQVDGSTAARELVRPPPPSFPPVSCLFATVHVRKCNKCLSAVLPSRGCDKI